MDSLPKDIISIIYRYVHKAMSKDVAHEYKTLFESAWIGDMFISNTVQAMWRLLDHYGFPKNKNIYNFYTNDIVGVLPVNYKCKKHKK